MEKFTLITFYHFVDLENYEDMKDELLEYCLRNNIRGTIILAEEGINASIAGENWSIRGFLSFIQTDDRFRDLEWKESLVDFQPFQEMKVRLKREVVALGDADLEKMTGAEVGEYVQPEDWDAFIARDDVKTIDTRNLYETKIGKFKYSIDPETTNFREFRDWVQKWINENNISMDQKVAMYCTGGVRCEKSTSYMKKIGFKNVFHLKGGILNYFIKTRNRGGSWLGNCFVFDDRVAVNENLKPVELECLVCNRVVDTDDLKNIPRGKVMCSKCSHQEAVNQ
ncbi:rhodanese-like domain protein [Neorickettsia helminthoeca str. Oregon]|uniref:tRNA uridine(34) hydroxylase n=1 Tax=Neorickettsia helminthoeca str. Oregon TaxID=1286528 RepID=X5HJE5_9RICK|nr:rhodanese-like domain-containing protein [Neorickettsia helminthoeca]AHX11199.1 rhodanese-like domain protein [Neorickettsia helminthoeca str. Oregon]